MSMIWWFLKPKSRMAKSNTKHVKIGKYKITSHAQNRIVDPTRKLAKKDMVINLFGKESKNSKVYTYKDGSKQYDRVNDKNQTLTYITKKENKVKTIQKYHSNAKGKKHAYRNF